MRKFNSLVLALCIISCTANQNDVNVVDRSISETESSTTRKDEISPVKTKFVWRNSFGEEFPVYINSHGSCFIIKKSKSGKSYRSYLGEEVLKQINNELSNRKSNNVVAQDTISSFWGKPIVINDKICEQISAIAAQDKKLSYSDSIIQIVNVRWRVKYIQTWLYIGSFTQNSFRRRWNMSYFPVKMSKIGIEKLFKCVWHQWVSSCMSSEV